MSDFDFISDDTLRMMLERDKLEMDNCLGTKNYKSVLILAGSLIEAILVDYFLTFQLQNVSREEILKAPLAKLANWAFEEDLISKQTFEISTVIRNYRNLIHPGKEYRIKERVDKHSSNVAANLVEILIDELREGFSKKIGYSADAAIKKVKIDPACASVFEHMVSQMVPSERLKLFTMIPEECRNEDIEENLRNFIKLHEKLSDCIPQDAVKRETEKIKEYLNNKSKEEILLYMQFFLRHLNLLDVKDKDTAISYLIEILASGNYYELLEIKRTNPYVLGKYIDDDDKRKLLTQAIFNRLWNLPHDADDIFLSILEGIFISLPNEFIEKITNRLKISHNSRDKSWSEKIDNFIPF